MKIDSALTYANDYEEALNNELHHKLREANAKTNLANASSLALSLAYANETIDGKNSDVRKRQEATVLLEDGAVEVAAKQLRECERESATATAIRHGAEMRAGIVKAWLYSTASIG